MEPTITEYRVNYYNGKSEVFYCTHRWIEAFCTATLYAIKQAWDPAIATITDGEIVIKDPKWEVPMENISLAIPNNK